MTNLFFPRPTTGCLRLGLNAVRVGRAATVRPELRNYTLDAMLTNHESVATFKKKLEGARGSSAKELQAARRDLEDAGKLCMYIYPFAATVRVLISLCLLACMCLQNSWRPFRS